MPYASGSPSSRETAEAIRAGNVSAFEAFLRSQWFLLVRYLVSFSRNVDDAEDLAQEAFVRLWEKRAYLDPTGSLRAYLYRIARNLALNERKSRELHRQLEKRDLDPSPSAPSPDRQLEEAELQAIVEQAIESLPPRRREAFILAHLQNLPHREVANVMGISPQTVANQISAALADLRRLLGAYVRLRNSDLRCSGEPSVRQARQVVGKSPSAVLGADGKGPTRRAEPNGRTLWT